MFTGIVRAIGRVVSATSAEGALRLAIDTGGLDTGAWHAGDSICLAGVCLTAEHCEAGRFTACASRETLAHTTLGSLVRGVAVNIEPAIVMGGALGGHFVTGHVDGVARVVAAREDAGSLQLSIEAPPMCAHLLAPKGSVTIDGVSLTVNRVNGSTFEVNIVPHTRAVTTLGTLASGAMVNFEADILARHLERLLDAQWRQ
ncbi:MAG: riboflavin synthase subunit alpha [Steroidobacteraceae bacterium]|nr:riboflavin synthase subunit alpha [Steroidobacteraceae bacterium]